MPQAHRGTRVGPATSEPDPVIEAYKKDIDRTLFESTLALTVEERLRDLMRLQRVADDLARSGRHAFDDRP